MVQLGALIKYVHNDINFELCDHMAACHHIFLLRVEANCLYLFRITFQHKHSLHPWTSILISHISRQTSKVPTPNIYDNYKYQHGDLKFYFYCKVYKLTSVYEKYNTIQSKSNLSSFRRLRISFFSSVSSKYMELNTFLSLFVTFGPEFI